MDQRVGQQLTLFDSPDVPVRSVPAHPKGGHFLPYVAHSRVRCEDCVLVLALAAWKGPVPAKAFVIYVKDGVKHYLCHGHARAQKEAIREQRKEERQEQP